MSYASSESPLMGSTLDPDWVPSQDLKDEDLTSSDEYRRTQSTFVEPEEAEDDFLALHPGNVNNISLYRTRQ